MPMDQINVGKNPRGRKTQYVPMMNILTPGKGREFQYGGGKASRYFKKSQKNHVTYYKTTSNVPSIHDGYQVHRRYNYLKEN